jgi:hypothetical protein
MNRCVECPNGWTILTTTMNVSRCYYFVNNTNKTMFTNGRDFCTNESSIMLTISDIDEYNTLNKYLTSLNTSQTYWIAISTVVTSTVYFNQTYQWFYGGYIGSYVNFGSGFVPPWRNFNNGSNYMYMGLYTGPNTFYMENFYTSSKNYCACKKLV